MLRLLLILVQLAADAVRWGGLLLRSQRSIEAENLFLRRQLALYVERGIEPRRIDSVTRVALAFLSRFFHWRDALVVVRPETMIRWHRAGWKLWWRFKSRPGRPSIPVEVQALIRRMANENPSWGEDPRARRSTTEHHRVPQNSRKQWGTLARPTPTRGRGILVAGTQGEAAELRGDKER